MTTSNYIKLKGSRFISISGEDRGSFLQALITNDIQKCNSRDPIYSCLLSPQGKFIADFFIIDYEKSYVVETHKNFVNELIYKLKIYKLGARVEINYINNFLSLSMINNYNLLQLEKGIIKFNDPRNDKLGSKLFIAQNKFKEIIKKYNFVENSFDNYRELLIRNLIPFSPEDMIPNKSLLLENNFDNINAIDWEKGCYVGQELTARMKYRALLKKKIRAVEIISGRVNRGNQIIFNQNEVGKIISSFKKLGIAMLKIKEAENIFKNNEILKTNSASLRIIH